MAMTDAAFHYCPYVPLQLSGGVVSPITMKPPPQIEQIESKPAIFRLRCDGDVYLPQAEKAFHWIMANVAQEDRHFENEPPEQTYSATVHVLVVFERDEIATLFKMFCM